MESIPHREQVPFIRTDFSNDAVWKSVCDEVRQPNAELQEAFDMMMAMNAHLSPDTDDAAGCIALVDILDSQQFANLGLEQLLHLVPPDFPHMFLFVFDDLTASHADPPILVVDLYQERGRSFRSTPDQIQAIENNLSISNMDWEDFTDSLDQDGIFRGFESTA